MWNLGCDISLSVCVCACVRVCVYVCVRERLTLPTLASTAIRARCRPSGRSASPWSMAPMLWSVPAAASSAATGGGSSACARKPRASPACMLSALTWRKSPSSGTRDISGGFVGASLLSCARV